MEEDFDKFLEKYKPIERSDSNYLWETYDEDWDHVKEKNAEGNFVWTVIDGEGSELWIIPGVHLVNRLNYIICEIPFEEGCQEEYEY